MVPLPRHAWEDHGEAGGLVIAEPAERMRATALTAQSGRGL